MNTEKYIRMYQKIYLKIISKPRGGVREYPKISEPGQGPKQ